MCVYLFAIHLILPDADKKRFIRFNRYDFYCNFVTATKPHLQSVSVEPLKKKKSTQKYFVYRLSFQGHLWKPLVEILFIAILVSTDVR